jgi:hypothetical protein
VDPGVEMFSTMRKAIDAIRSYAWRNISNGWRFAFEVRVLA